MKSGKAQRSFPFVISLAIPCLTSPLLFVIGGKEWQSGAKSGGW